MEVRVPASFKRGSDCFPHRGNARVAKRTWSTLMPGPDIRGTVGGAVLVGGGAEV
jgi:hypothetical protein